MQALPGPFTERNSPFNGADDAGSEWIACRAKKSYQLPVFFFLMMLEQRIGRQCRLNLGLEHDPTGRPLKLLPANYSSQWRNVEDPLLG